MTNEVIKMFEMFGKLNSDFKLNEGNIKVPEEVLNKTDELFDFINNNIDRLKNYSANKGCRSPYIDPSLGYYFELNNLKNEPIYIRIGFYNDENDGAVAGMSASEKVLTINMAFWESETKSDFKSLIEHEIVHAMDPLLTNNFGSYYNKKGSTPVENKDKYYKSQHEYNAFLSTLMTLLKKYKIDVKWSIEFFNSIKNTNATIEDYYFSTPDATKTYLSFGNDNVDQGYWSFLAEYFPVIKSWGTKPTLYADAMKKIYSGLN